MRQFKKNEGRFAQVDLRRYLQIFVCCKLLNIVKNICVLGGGVFFFVG